MFQSFRLDFKQVKLKKEPVAQSAVNLEMSLKLSSHLLHCFSNYQRCSIKHLDSGPWGLLIYRQLLAYRQVLQFVISFNPTDFYSKSFCFQQTCSKISQSSTGHNRIVKNVSPWNLQLTKQRRTIPHNWMKFQVQRGGNKYFSGCCWATADCVSAHLFSQHEATGMCVIQISRGRGKWTHKTRLR